MTTPLERLTGGVEAPASAGKPGSSVSHAKTLFKRSDTPFLPNVGTEIALVAEGGFTAAGWLAVPFRFQCPPMDSLSRSTAHQWASYTVTGGKKGPSERTRSEGKRLKTMTLKTVVLNWEPDWQVWSPDELEPQLAAAELEALCDAGVKFRLRVKNASLYDYDDVNMLAVLTQVEVTEEAGEPDARYLQLSFQEWAPTQVEVNAKKKQLGPWTHELTLKDTAYSLSHDYYHTYSLWRLILAANGLRGGPSTPLVQLVSAFTVRRTPKHVGKGTLPLVVKVVKIPAKPPPPSSTLNVPGERETEGIVLP